MDSLRDLHQFTASLPRHDYTLPALFIGHGSPMNGIEGNEFSKEWALQGQKFPPPSAVLVISAHWYTKGTWITAMEKPRTIHDFYGFPQELFTVQYPAPGLPPLARDIAQRLSSFSVQPDHEWGLDHGAWTVVRHMFPDATIPVLQLSIDHSKPPDFHYRLAQELSVLRNQGVLIIGSGNLVHNLRMMNWNMKGEAFDWAVEGNTKLKQLVEVNQVKALADYTTLGTAVQLAIPSPDHYLPLMYTLGVRQPKDHLEFFNDKTVMGSVSMTCVKLT